jgi:hypothetical protein
MLTGDTAICKACAEGKAKQKNVIVAKQKRSFLVDDGRIHLDISSIRNTDFPEVENMPKPYWWIIVDQRTQLKFSDFFATKNGMVEPTCILIDGEGNKALENRIKSSD